MDAEALERELREALRELAGLEEDVPRDEPLLSTGRIDSVDIARVATFLEERTGLSIPDRDIGSANFDSVASILAYLERRRGS